MALVNGSERSAVSAAQAGSLPDFEALFHQHWPRSYRAAHLIVLDQAPAEQLVADAFAAAVRSLDGFDDEHPFGPFLHRTVVTRSVDRARVRAGRRGTFQDDPALEQTQPFSWDLPVAGPHTHPDVRAVAVGVAALTPEERGVVVLRCLLDYSQGEIARLLELDRRTVRNRLERGLEGLRARLGAGEPLSEAALRGLLLSQPVPGEQLAQERTWDAVRAAFERRDRRPRPRRWPVKTLAVLAFAALCIGVGLSPLGPRIGGWFQDRLGRERVVVAPTGPARSGLPEPGRLLVLASGRALIVDEQGARTQLGRWKGASWSPGGRFVAVWRRHSLSGIDPADPSLPLWHVRGKRIAAARWSGDEHRLAYLDGKTLRAVDENGTHDRRLAGDVAPVAPVWETGEEHTVAYAETNGRTRVLDADSGKRLWRARRAGTVVALAWTADGDRLAVLARSVLRVLRKPGSVLVSEPLPAGTTATTLAARPGSADLAYSVVSTTSGIGSVFLLDGKTGESHLLFSGAGAFDELDWSPSGRLLLVPWKAADQWLYLPPGGAESVDVTPSVSRSSASGAPHGVPVPAGWCCVKQPS